MTTNLSLDPDLLDRAMEVSGERTKKAAVTRALEEFIARRKQKRLIDLMGKLEISMAGSCEAAAVAPECRSAPSTHCSRNFASGTT